MDDLAIILCTEEPIETQSILLCRSIRTFGGRFKNVPIFSFSPRENHAASLAAIHELKRLGVEHRYMPLNTKFSEQPLANKPYVCAYAEKTVGANNIVFLDSDTIVLREPTLMLLRDDVDAAMRPVHRRNIGTTDLSDASVDSRYWRELYALGGGIVPSSTVTTTVDRVHIFPYFNSGVIITRRTARIFGRWRDDFERVMENGVYPSRPNKIEQSVLSAILGKKNYNVQILPITYNYPLGDRHRMRLVDRRSMSELTVVHYHREFSAGKWRTFLDRMMSSDPSAHDKYLWLKDNLESLES